MRVRNLLTIFVFPVSLSVLLATAGMDVRSYRALDEWYDRYGSVFFDVNSFNGRCVIQINERLELRTDVNPRTDPLASVHPYALLQRYDPTAPGDSSAWAHQRFFVAETEYFEPSARPFPLFSFKQWLAFAHDGWCQYDRETWVTIPYWSVMLIAVAAVIWSIIRLMRCHWIERGAEGEPTSQRKLYAFEVIER